MPEFPNRFPPHANTVRTPESKREPNIYSSRQMRLCQDKVEREVDVYGISLEDRADTPELQALLAELYQEARQIERELFEAYPIPSEQQTRALFEDDRQARRRRRRPVHPRP